LGGVVRLTVSACEQGFVRSIGLGLGRDVEASAVPTGLFDLAKRVACAVESRALVDDGLETRVE
jgi:hypothetical protein